MKQTYVTALIDSIIDGVSVETALKNLHSLLKRRGHERLWSQILKLALRQLETKLSRVIPQVTLATADRESETAIRDALVTLGASYSTNYSTTIDQSLIGGCVLGYRDRLLDMSYKRALITLYENITK